jgi:hypothetical protein
MHVEFIACHDTIGQVIWLKKFVPDLRVVDCINKPLKMYCEWKKIHIWLFIHSRRGSYFVRSSKQKLVASSTMHAEFIACHDTIGRVIWLKKFVPDLRVVDCINKPLKMYCDNQPAVYYAHNNKSSNASKPIEVKFYVVKDRIWDKTISLEHIGTQDMVADPLTKGLPPNVFKKHLTGMGLRESI